MTENEIKIKLLKEMIDFFSYKPGVVDFFYCQTTDVKESELEEFEKKWDEINKSGKSYIEKVELVENPDGLDEIGMLFKRRLDLRIYSDDYIEWAKKEISELMNE